MSKKALIIDHDDSFIWNIKFWLQPEFNITILNHSELKKLQDSEQINTEYELVIFSPGPKSPENYPGSLDLLNKLKIPALGVCLGFQMMTLNHQGHVKAYCPPLHGKTSLLHCEYPDYNNLRVARYHSLHCEPSDEFKILARSQDDDVVMWAEHKKKKHLGFQFHPESFLTEHADKYKSYILNWLSL